VDLELKRVQGDFPIRIYDSMGSEAKDILRRLEGGWDFEFSEERAAFF